MFGSARFWNRAAGTVLCLWLLLSAGGIYRDHLSYFNEAACLFDNPARVGIDGGTACGPSWLDDSNIDWGQGLKQLKVWLDRNPTRKKIHLTYFGMFPPEQYGISTESLRDDDLVSPREPGLYIVSSHIVASTPAIAKALGGGAEWLRTTPPIAIVGHAFYVYDIQEPTAAGR
jgi:hypothetical protein